MKKYIKLTILFLICIVLTSCTTLVERIKFDGITDDIIKPENKSMIIEGTWKISEKLVPDGIEEDIIEKYNNANWFYISNELVKFQNRFTTNPNFKTRYINYNEFMKDSLKGSIETDILDGEGPLLTVTDGQYFYQDILVLSEEKIAFLYDGIMFVFDKADNNVSKEIVAEAKELSKTEESSEDASTDMQSDTAVLLGIKTPRKDQQGNSYYSYKTVMIRRSSKGEPVIYSIKNLLLPRNTGFWMVGQEHIVDENGSRDVLFANPLAVENNDGNRYLLGDKNNSSITYLGKDYVSLEIYNYISSDRTYGIFNLNNLADNTRIDVMEIAGETGVQTFKDDTVKALSGSTIEGNILELNKTNNIGIKRTNDRWNFISNIVLKHNSNLQTREYRVSLVPTIDIVENDTLSVPWESVKNKLPGAIDAYSSPDESMLIVQNSNELLAFDLENGIISNESFLSARINETDRIIMAQWVQGEQTSVWEETLRNQEILPINFIFPH